MIPSESLIHLTLNQVHSIINESRVDDDTAWLCADSLLFSGTHYFHGYLRYLCGTFKGNSLPAEQSMLDYFKVLRLIPTERESAAARALEGRYFNQEHTRQVCLVAKPNRATVKSGYDCLRSLYLFLRSDENQATLCRTLARYKALSESSGRSRAFIGLDMVQEYTDDIRVAHVNRSKVLFELSLSVDSAWVGQVKVDYLKSLMARYRRHFIAYAHTVCVKAGSRVFYLKNQKEFTIGWASQRINKEYYSQDAEYVDLQNILSTKTHFRNSICNLAIMEMNDGDNINVYLEKLCAIVYLLRYYFKGKPEETTMELYFEDLFTEEIHNDKLLFDSVVKGSKILLDDVIAAIGKPSFERFRDTQARTKYAFDYITVDTTLITRYGKSGVDIIKANLEEFKQRVLRVCAESKRLKDKPLLQKLLYVKEFAVSGNGYVITSFVEFKPGVEDVLSDTGATSDSEVSKMELS